VEHIKPAIVPPVTHTMRHGTPAGFSLTGCVRGNRAGSRSPARLPAVVSRSGCPAGESLPPSTLASRAGQPCHRQGSSSAVGGPEAARPARRRDSYRWSAATRGAGKARLLFSCAATHARHSEPVGAETIGQPATPVRESGAPYRRPEARMSRRRPPRHQAGRKNPTIPAPCSRLARPPPSFARPASGDAIYPHFVRRWPHRRSRSPVASVL
jgi:hypothetical protein